MLLDTIAIGIVGLALYAFYAASGIYPGDAGDLVTAAATGGIPHPPGFPLYTVVGWVLTRFSIGTPAWNMAWLSIIPHVGTLVVVYLLVHFLTKSRLASLFAVATLAGNYLFFLYSTTPEVFALLDFFIILLFYLSVVCLKRPGKRVLVSIGLFTGLALSHHTLIVLIFPAVFYLLFTAFRRGHIPMRTVMAAGAAALAGLMPYLYFLFAARGSSPINWDRPITLARFIQLITRADYGSFMSGSVVGHAVIERLLNVKAYITFVLMDFTWIGILLCGIGLWWLWNHHRTVAKVWIASLFLFGPFFSFYSSFPIVNRFVLGTVERFALPSYVLMAPLVGIGMMAVSSFAADKMRWLLKTPQKQKQLTVLIICVFFLYPTVITGMNVWRFSGLSSDMTTDNFAKDILNSAPDHAIVLLTRDTPLFGVQYMRYARGYRQDTIVLHMARMNTPDYEESMRLLFPAVVFPSLPAPQEAYLTSFIADNYRMHPIVANTPLADGTDWVWVPHGLLFELVRKDAVPTAAVLLSSNQQLWQSYHDPLLGLLGRYRHLFLTNVLDEYAIASNEYGKYLLRMEEIDTASKQFDRAIGYGSDTQTTTAWMYQGVADMLKKKCIEAFDAFDHAQQPLITPNSALLYYRAVTYRDCVGDASRSAELFSQYQNESRQEEQPLEAPLQAP